MFKSTYREIFPFWDDIAEEDRDYICSNSSSVLFKEGTNVHDAGGCSGVIYIKTGTLRVYIMSDDGKDITLYRLHTGDLCLLSATCVLSNITFDVFVDAEEDSDCFVISGPAFADASEKYSQIKIFALETAVSRFSDVMWVMEQIHFMSMDKRLAIFLYEEITRIDTDTVRLTHALIAKYMGSAREVVTRMLKYFANRGIVELSRKGVKITDKEKLKELAFQ